MTVGYNQSAFLADAAMSFMAEHQTGNNDPHKNT